MRANPALERELSFAMAKDEWPHCVAFSPDGCKIIAGTNAGNVWLWERKKGAIATTISLTTGDVLTGSVLCVAYSPDGKTVLAGCADHKIRVLDIVSGKVKQVLNGHDRPVFAVAYSADGTHALSGTSGGRSVIILWDLMSGMAQRKYNTTEIVDCLAIAPDGKHFLTTEFKSIGEWNLDSGRHLRNLDSHEYRVYGVFYSPDGASIISGGWDGIRIWNRKTGKCERKVFANAMFQGQKFALSPDGRRILVGKIKKMQLLDLETGTELNSWKDLEAEVSVAISPDGELALSGEAFGPVSVWRLPKQPKKKQRASGK